GGYRVDLLDKSLFASLYRWEEDHYVLTDDEAYEPRTEKFKHYTPTKDTALFSPTGGMKISALHLARYMLMHMNYGTTPDGIQIIPKELSLEMQTPRSSDENYGLALWKTEEYSPGTILTGHTGGAYGMRSAMFFHPEEKYGFIVISNGAHEVANDGKTNILKGALSRMFKHFIGA
ncbi:MAG: serine hydrolase, partial [Bacteroidaceae bacterium]|nr:serine hydrolase [Bacteroidaceae bacterium]